MQKPKIGFVLFLLAIIGSSCKKINQISEESKEEYTVSGVIYDVDGETPIKNWRAELIRTYIPKLSNNKDFLLGEIVTDDNGYFTINYSEIPEERNYGLYISGQVPGIYTPLHIVECIPPNQNIEIIESIRPHEKVRIELKNQQLLKNDTLFYGLSDPYKPRVEITGKDWSDKYMANFIILGYDSIYHVKNYTSYKCISFDFTGNTGYYKKDSVEIYFGVGKNKFQEVFFNRETYPQNKVMYYPKPFPEVSELVIDLKK